MRALVSSYRSLRTVALMATVALAAGCVSPESAPVSAPMSMAQACERAAERARGYTGSARAAADPAADAAAGATLAGVWTPKRSNGNAEQEWTCTLQGSRASVTFVPLLDPPPPSDPDLVAAAPAPEPPTAPAPAATPEVSAPQPLGGEPAPEGRIFGKPSVETAPEGRVFGQPADPAPEPRIFGQPPTEPCLIKGNISYSTGERIYHVPGQAYYAETVINPDFGERWFCTEGEAIAAGWRRAHL